MPFTPYHFGPGALFKAILQKHFSFALFVLTQLVMDLEPYYFLFKNETWTHRLFHTYLGASIPVLIGVFLGKPLVEHENKDRILHGSSQLRDRRL